MLGDNLYGGHSASDFESKFERPYKPLLDEGVQFFASLGNHDNNNEVSYAPFNMNGRRYYTFTKGNAEFFVLDSNYMEATQLSWLRDELQKSTSEWKIAYFHHPLYSGGKRHGADTDLRSVLEPVFKKYKVNVVLSGHDHVYERTTPQSNIVYFVLGNSGQLRSGGLEKDEEEAAGFDKDRCFMVMEIAGSELYFQTISRSGQTVDSGMVKHQTDTAAEAGAAPETPSKKAPL
jgi:3',5'-cyclic AMP phosphodiesterase CpdA